MRSPAAVKLARPRKPSGLEHRPRLPPSLPRAPLCFYSDVFPGFTARLTDDVAEALRATDGCVRLYPKVFLPLATTRRCTRRCAQAMENGGSSGSGPNSPAQAIGGNVPRRQPRAGANPLLIICRYFGIVTAATALLCVAVNVLSAVHSFRGVMDVSPAARASPVLLIPPVPAMGARERADWGLMCVLVASFSSVDNRGHIPVLRSGVCHLRRRP